jgi:hypothetical protein
MNNYLHKNASSFRRKVETRAHAYHVSTGSGSDRVSGSFALGTDSIAQIRLPGRYRSRY